MTAPFTPVAHDAMVEARRLDAARHATYLRLQASVLERSLFLGHDIDAARAAGECAGHLAAIEKFVIGDLGR